MSEDKKTDFLSLPLDVEHRDFSSVEELQEWLSEEKKALSWVQAAARKDNSINPMWGYFNTWFSEVNQFLEKASQNNIDDSQLDNAKKILVNKLNQLNKKGSLKTSSSPDVEFSEVLRSKVSDIEAAYALAFLFGINFSLSSTESVRGAYRAVQYEQGSTETVEAVQASLESTKRSWAKRFSHQLSKLKSENEDLTENKDRLTSEIDSLKKDLEEIKSLQKIEFKELVDNSRESLEDIQKTYDEKLSLQSSVSYWKNKRRSHSVAMVCMGVASIVIAASVAASFLFVGYKFLQVGWNEVQAWQIGLMLAISTFGVWLTRLSTKIFISNLHLRTDADERVTMIQTYLALLREGTGLDESDRQLILQTLFRPSSTGYFNDEVPHSPHELMINVLRRNQK